MAANINEQETTIQFSRDGKMCRMWTSDTHMISKMDKLAKEFPDVYKIVRESTARDEVVDKTYEYPKKFAYPRKPRPEMSEERKIQMRQRMMEMRTKKNNID